MVICVDPISYSNVAMFSYFYFDDGLVFFQILNADCLLYSPEYEKPFLENQVDSFRRSYFSP